MRSLTSGKTPRSIHALMHSFLFHQIAKVSPEWSAKIHDTGEMLPFSISPIMGIQGSEIIENQSLSLRIAILHDLFENILIETMEKGLWKEPFRLEKNLFQVEEIVVGKQNNNLWSGRESYEELNEISSVKKSITIEIATPLAFKRSDLHYPLPEVSLFFKNILHRWNLCCPYILPEETEHIHIGYSYINIQTIPYSLRKGGSIVGCIGRLTFILKASEAERKLYHKLLRFAFYSGVGVKTAQGMGMIRITKAE